MNVKPMMLVNDDLSEGVYAASGTPAAAEVTYTLKESATWEGNKNYDISFTNHTNKKIDSVTVTLKVHGNVKSIDGVVSGSVNGSTATITFNNYGNGIEANSTVGPVYMHVAGVGVFSLE